MPLLDQFRRPDRGNAPPSGEEKKNPLENAHPPASTTAAIAEESLPNHASEEDAA